VEIAREILATHQPLPIEPDAARWIEKQFSDSLILTARTH
jgi:hypothetical protein